MPENHQHNHGDTLPPDLQRLHNRLLDDGAAWRAEYPSGETFRRRVREFGETPMARVMEPGTQAQQRRESDRIDMNHLSLPPSEISPGNAPRGSARRRSFRGVAAVAATLLIAILFGVAFQMVSGNRPGQVSTTSTRTPSASTWEKVGQFQSRNGERVAVAPSDPYFAYRLNSGTFAMERSDDGGRVWQAVTLPAEVTQSPLKNYAVLDINPLAAKTVYLTAFSDPSSASCPSPFSPAGQSLRNFRCSVQYVSTDGGQIWRRLMLPSNGRLTGMLSQVLGSPRAPLLPQGNRVYSLMTTDAYVGEYRLVVSSDGINWQFADADLAATGLRIEDYVAAPTGSTIWVTLSDGGLWRSDNAGQNWTRIANPPNGSLAAAGTIDGASVLYTTSASEPLGDIAPTGVQVSADGGKTWQASPASGIPVGQHAAPYSAMTRPDGTLVMLFRTPQLNIAFDEGILHDAAYYAWKPGEKSWTRLTSTFNAEAVQQTWITPADDVKPLETIWAVIYQDPTLTYEGESYIKDGTYTIAGYGLKP